MEGRTAIVRIQLRDVFGKEVRERGHELQVEMTAGSHTKEEEEAGRWALTLTLPKVQHPIRVRPVHY